MKTKLELRNASRTLGALNQPASTALTYEMTTSGNKGPLVSQVAKTANTKLLIGAALEKKASKR